jgi:hypothetical protein
VPVRTWDGGQQFGLPLKGPNVPGDPGVEALFHGSGLVDPAQHRLGRHEGSSRT